MNSNGAKKSFQFRPQANSMLDSICDAVRRLVNQNIFTRLGFHCIGLYSVLYRIRLDTSLPEGDLDCVGALQSWLNKHLIEDLNQGFSSSLETALCISHAMQLCVGKTKRLQCFVLLEDNISDNIITESTVLIWALRAISQVVTRRDKTDIYTILFKHDNNNSSDDDDNKNAAGDSSSRVGMNGMVELLVISVLEYRSDLEVVSQWCSTLASLASSSSLVDLKTRLGTAGACAAAATLLDMHKTRPSLVQDILWCLCSLSANNQHNLSHILQWRGGSGLVKGGSSIVSLLQTLYKSRSQTNETRENAELLLGWLDMASEQQQHQPEGESQEPTTGTANSKSSGNSSSISISGRDECIGAVEIYRCEAALYPLVSNADPQRVVWTKGEPGVYSTPYTSAVMRYLFVHTNG